MGQQWESQEVCLDVVCLSDPVWMLWFQQGFADMVEKATLVTLRRQRRSEPLLMMLIWEVLPTCLRFFSYGPGHVGPGKKPWTRGKSELHDK